MKRLQLLIKPASSMCNMKCSYCFYRDEAEHRETANYGIMNPEIKQSLIKNALSCAEEECVFAFQGGEPTIAGLEWFRDFVDCVQKEKREEQNIRYTIQTNGTLLNDKWFDFFRENNFLVGLSLDGTQAVHNRYRKDRYGKGTFSSVYSAAKKMQELDIRLNILTVLTGDSAENIEEIYEFFKREGFFYQQYIPCIDPIGEAPGGRIFSVQPGQYGRALKKLFDLWFRDTLQGEEIFIRQFENWMTALSGGEPETCSMRGKCTMQNVTEANGDVYPCDFYAVDGYCAGNVTENTFDELQRRAECGGFLKEWRQQELACWGCRYYPLCRGGCRRDIYLEGDQYYQYFCQGYKEFFQYAISRMEWLLGE